jgi:AAA domain
MFTALQSKHFITFAAYHTEFALPCSVYYHTNRCLNVHVFVHADDACYAASISNYSMLLVLVLHVRILTFIRVYFVEPHFYLQDYRRTNVAITRAKSTCILIGNAATLGASHQHNKAAAGSSSSSSNSSSSSGSAYEGTMARLVADAHSRGVVITAEHAYANM